MTNSPLHSDRNDIGNTDWLFDQFMNDPNISQDFQQTLTRILALDAINGIWKSLQTDQLGRLYVTTQQVQGAIPVITNVNVIAATETLLLSANNNRRAFMVINNGGSLLQLYFNSGTSNPNIPLFPSGVYNDDVTLGAVFAKGVGANVSTIVVEY